MNGNLYKSKVLNFKFELFTVLEILLATWQEPLNSTAVFIGFTKGLGYEALLGAR